MKTQKILAGLAITLALGASAPSAWAKSCTGGSDNKTKNLQEDGKGSADKSDASANSANTGEVKAPDQK